MVNLRIHALAVAAVGAVASSALGASALVVPMGTSKTTCVSSNMANVRRSCSQSHCPPAFVAMASHQEPVIVATARIKGAHGISRSVALHMSSPTDTDSDQKKEKATTVAQAEFWKAQQALADSMNAQVDKSAKEESREKFAKRRLGLVNETLLFSTLIFSFLWLIGSNPFTAISFAFGATLGTAYSYGLGKYVETIGGSADDVEDLQGAGVGQARFAFLILLFIFVGKFRSVGLQEIPSIMGFFTYQIASLSQGLREYDD